VRDQLGRKDASQHTDAVALQLGSETGEVLFGKRPLGGRRPPKT
jgi:hypothetical protein